MDPFEYIQFVQNRESGLHVNAAHSDRAHYAFVKEEDSHNVDLSSMAGIDSYRTPWLVDLDLITYSKYASKQTGKTQIFIAPNDTLYTTRATHTNIVMNLAAELARGLQLNEDLVRAMAKGHDIGHTAFGHFGEKALDEICQVEFTYRISDEPILSRVSDPTKRDVLITQFYVNDADTKVFSHAKQSYRLLAVFEGKRITAETAYGIINHNQIDARNTIDMVIRLTRARDPNPLKQTNVHGVDITEHHYIGLEHNTYEAQLLRYADFISFCIHDLDDALKARVLDENVLVDLFSKSFPALRFGDYLSGNNRYTQFLKTYIDHNKPRVEMGVEKLEIPYGAQEILDWIYEQIISKRVHKHPTVDRKNYEAKRYIEGIFNVWKHSERDILELAKDQDLAPELNIDFHSKYSSVRKFCDLISILSDREIIGLYRAIYGPEK